MTTGTERLITQLQDILNGHQEIAQWSVLKQTKREWQHYLVKNYKVEATREVTNETYLVTVYHKHAAANEEETAMGAATITLTNADLNRLAEKIEEGVLAASLTNNKPWSLPKPADFPHVELTDTTTLINPVAAIEGLVPRMKRAIEAEEHIRFSAAEFFFEELVSTIHNSEGVFGEQRETLFTLELVLFANNGQDPETEHFVLEKRRRIEDLPIEAVVKHNARNARDSLKAVLPKTWQGAVVVSSEVLPELLAPLKLHVSGEGKFVGLSRAVIGENFLGEREIKGDALSVTFSATLPYGVNSASFTQDGIAGQEVHVVQENVFTTYLTSQRYADYLDVPVTGDQGNIVLPPGSRTEAELLKGPLFFIQAFSAVSPSFITGDFAGEIKLGYFIDEHGNRTAVKGGSVSGNIFDALADAHYSQETEFAGTYQGPKVIRFNQLQIAGE